MATAATTFSRTSTTDEVLSGLDLTGKRILITGTSAGLGIETARALVAHGAEVTGAVRDLAKGERAAAPIYEAAKTGNGSFHQIELDLGNLTNVRAATDKLLAEGRQFDAILANAGVMATPFGHTADGFETQFGTNHLGHFVFINRLTPLLREGARIINLSSSGHRFSPVHLDDPNFTNRPYDPWLSYGQSKTANILFAVELDRRLKSKNIRAAAVHPGGIMTELARHLDPAVIENMLADLNKQAAEQGKESFQWKTVPQGAATTVWAAFTAPADAVGGRYCEDCIVSPIVTEDKQIGLMEQGVRPYALDPENAQALWTLSEQLVNERF